MTTRSMKTGSSELWLSARRIAMALAIVVFGSSVLSVYAQGKFSKTYPARKNIRVHLTNWSGPISVEGWQRNEIKITAIMEAPEARFTPQLSTDGLEIDVVRENQGRGDVGNVSFKIYVPFDTTVDIETRFGDLNVRNVNGGMVRAHITSEGDIELTNIRSPLVMAENVAGDIFFDGDLLGGGVYTFMSTVGNISIRIPADSAFSLVATAPMSRNITLGSFSTAGLRVVNDGRKVIGNVGDGRAALSVTNQRGNISFFRR